ncbi:hypothetical protein [Bythopirellula polymerisocia]|uniref:Chromosome partition protein Smc n=1 Tax=Bythopirellula polymerisocia TaxID=2528003 RepID=A0A5C6CUE6_9BACT|nr:hypothetical protein [Bythopirellula polymerisocia]TWU28583.1 Chromosome partition protein Smc [Bythopirellula polymerisocia]
MDQILTQVSRARRRLWFELFLNRLVTSCFVALTLALVAIAVPKFVAIENLPTRWSLWCALAGLGLGFLSALVWSLVDGLSELDAAVEIDSRFNLRERVSSSLALSSNDAESPAGQALLADAARAVHRLEVTSQFGIQIPRKRWLPLLTTCLAFFVVSFFGNQVALSSADPHAAIQAKQQRENVSKTLRERLVEKRKLAAEKGLKEAEGLFGQLEKETEKLAKAKDADRKKTLVKLNDLAKELAERRDQLGGDKELRKQLAKLNNLNQGPADKMAEAMKQGNWQQASQELEKLKKQLAQGKLDEEAKKALMEQMKQMQEKLAEAAAAQEQAMEDLKKQIEKQQKDGNLAEAGELQQKLEQMQKQKNLNDKLGQLGSQMGALQDAMKKGDNGKAAQAMSDMMEQMEQLEQQMQEGEMLTAAMDQLQMAKDAMACSECQGMGCATCQGNMFSNQFSEKAGNGMGAGRGFGPRPDEKNDVNFRDSRVRQNPGRGAAVLAGEADGPNMRGNVAEAIKEEMASVGSTLADPQVVEQLPKSRREHAEEYFNTLREGR